MRIYPSDVHRRFEASLEYYKASDAKMDSLVILHMLIRKTNHTLCLTVLARYYCSTSSHEQMDNQTPTGVLECCPWLYDSLR